MDPDFEPSFPIPPKSVVKSMSLLNNTGDKNDARRGRRKPGKPVEGHYSHRQQQQRQQQQKQKIRVIDDSPMEVNVNNPLRDTLYHNFVGGAERMRRNARGIRTGKGICTNPHDLVANNGPSLYNNNPEKRKNNKWMVVKNERRTQQIRVDVIQKDMKKQKSVQLTAACPIYTVDQSFPVATSLPSFERFYGILFYNWTHPEEYLLDEFYWHLTHPNPPPTPTDSQTPPPPVLQTGSLPESFLDDTTRQCKYAMLNEKLCKKANVEMYHKLNSTSTSLQIPSRYDNPSHYYSTLQYGVLDEARGNIVSGLSKWCKLDTTEALKDPNCIPKMSYRYNTTPPPPPPSTPVLKLVTSDPSTEILEPPPALFRCVLKDLTRHQLTGDIIEHFRVGSIMLLVPTTVWERGGEFTGEKGNECVPFFAAVHPTTVHSFSEKYYGEKHGMGSSIEVKLFSYLPSCSPFYSEGADGSNPYNFPAGTTFYYLPLGSITTLVRSFDSMERGIDVPFMSNLIGIKKSTHIRFGEDEEDEEGEEVREQHIEKIEKDHTTASTKRTINGGDSYGENDKCSDGDSQLKKRRVTNGEVINGDNTNPDDANDSTFEIERGGTSNVDNLGPVSKPLNASQLKAMNLFIRKCIALNGKYFRSILQEDLEPSTPPQSTLSTTATTITTKRSSKDITLVQGPPGTGKTTFTVQTLLKILHRKETSGQRSLVCAPSNKAILVVASRFLAEHSRLLKEKGLSFSDATAQIGLIGVEAKLSEESRAGDNESVESIFVWRYLDRIVDDLNLALTHFSPFDQLLDTINPQGMRSNGMNGSNMVKILDIVEDLKKRIRSHTPKTYQEHFKHSFDQVLASLEKHDYKSARQQLIFCRNFARDEIDSGRIVAERLNTCRVIFCTLSSAGSSTMKATNKVDNLIVDEAGACIEADIMIPFILRPRGLLLIGDPKQLPATTMSQRGLRMKFERSMLERMQNELGYEYTMLDTQYRMDPEISQFPGLHWYGGKLKDGVIGYAAGEEGQPDLFRVSANRNEGPLCFFDTQGRMPELQSWGGSYNNEGEAVLVVKILRKLYEEHLSRIGRNKLYEGLTLRQRMDLKHSWCTPDKVRVITFYAAQVGEIKKQLRKRGFKDENITVATVDSSQGCEAETVILSFVRSGGGVGFLNDERRLNVGLTRAKKKCIIVGDLRTIKKGITLKKFVHNILGRENVIINKLQSG